MLPFKYEVCLNCEECLKLFGNLLARAVMKMLVTGNLIFLKCCGYFSTMHGVQAVCSRIML